MIVWNTSDVYLQESNLAGENMSDIYVKWLVFPIESTNVK